MFADWILPRPEEVGQCPVDHDVLDRVARIRIFRHPAAQQRNAHRGEVSGRDGGALHEGTRNPRIVGLAFRQNIHAASQFERQFGGYGRGLHAGEPADTLDQSFPKRQPGGRLQVARSIQRDVGGEHSLAGQSPLRLEQAAIVGGQEDSAVDQNQGGGDLADHQSSQSPLAGFGSRLVVAALFERCDEIGSCGDQGRCDPAGARRIV